MIEDREFMTNNGYTTIKKENITAYTIKKRHLAQMDTITQVDVFMTCGTVFTINSVDVDDFKDWVGKLNE